MHCSSVSHSIASSLRKNIKMIRYRYNAAQVLYKVLNEDIDVSSTDDSDDEPDFVESDIDELDSAGAVNVRRC